MTTHINLTTEMEQFLKSKVASGFYGNVTEVIRDAIRRMQQEDARQQTWVSAIQQGITPLDQGLGITWSQDLMRKNLDALKD